jgi:hypothetical protein
MLQGSNKTVDNRGIFIIICPHPSLLSLVPILNKFLLGVLIADIESTVHF